MYKGPEAGNPSGFHSLSKACGDSSSVPCVTSAEVLLTVAGSWRLSWGCWPGAFPSLLPLPFPLLFLPLPLSGLPSSSTC